MRAFRCLDWTVFVVPGLVACASAAPIAPPTPSEIVTDEPSSDPLPVAHPVATRPVAHLPESLPRVVARQCDVDLASRIGPTCHVAFPITVTATAAADGAAQAFDGSACSIWNAGRFAPASVTVDLGATVDIDAFVLVPEMTPNGSVTHRIEVSDDGVAFAPSQRIEAPMQSGEPVDLRLPERVHARFVRFATDASPSWVAWREIAVVHCGAARSL